MQLSTRAGAMVLAALLLLSSAIDPAAAAFSPDDPRYARLYTLEKQASDLFDSDDYALSMSQRTRDAWARLRDAALRVKVDGHPHPLAGVAAGNLASMDQIDGRNPGALANADRALEWLAPFADTYPVAWMQALSIKGYVQAALGDVPGGADTLAQASAYMDGYIARTDPKDRDEATNMLRSNIAFSHGQALVRLGRYAEAAEAQRISMEARIAASGPNSADVVGSYYSYSQMLSRIDRDAEAEHYARLAVDVATDHVDRKHPSYARALEALGLLLSRTGRRTESLDYLKRAIAIKRETVGTNSLYFDFALQNLGTVLLPLERYDDAEPLFMEAERGFRAIEGDGSPQSARALAFAGATALAQGRSSDAINRLQTALARVKAASEQDRDIGQRVYPFLIPALIDAGRADDARAAAHAFASETAQLDNAPELPLANAAMLERRSLVDPRRVEAAGKVAQLLRDDQTLHDDGELTEDQRAALDGVLAIAADVQDADLALDAMAILAGSKIAQANRLVAERLVADPALAARVRALQDRVKALQAADRVLLRALATDGDVAPARAARDALSGQVVALRAAIARDYPRWVEARGGAKPDLAAVRAGLAPGEALLAVTPAFDHVYVLAIGRDGTRVERMAMNRADVVALIDRLRGSLTPSGMDMDAATRIHDQIFTPAIQSTLGRASSLRLVPTGAFASLPFALLPQKPGMAIGRKTPWLIRRYAMEVQPSFAMEREPAMARTASASPRFLGVGAPLPFAGAAGAEQLADGRPHRGSTKMDRLSQLPPLPASAEELGRVARRFGPGGATLMLGEDASESTLRAADLTRYSVMLFATHGLSGGEVEGVAEPALLLSPPAAGQPGDGLLTASEVAEMRIGADWVILSACNTAAGDSAAAPVYSGLAQAFRYAGAGSLLVSHWPVRDDASAFVTLETVKGAGRGLSRAVALQRAMLKLMRSSSPDAAQPYIWAPFILVGR